VRPSEWPQNGIFDSIQRAAGMDGAEMRATFNCGIGMAAIVEPNAASLTIETINNGGIDAWQIGEVMPMIELGGAKYVEA
jgi:phosphoribosylformylglycinamidine cyclo-ligase